MRRAISEWSIQGQVALATGAVLGPLLVREVPSTIFIDAQGQLVAAASGPRWALEARISRGRPSRPWSARCAWS